MSDTRGAGNDPSMDDILASIRKIISDDEARSTTVGGTRQGAPQSRQAPPQRVEPRSMTPPPAARPAAAAQDDVLLLTDIVEEPRQAAPVAQAPPQPAPRQAQPAPFPPAPTMRPAAPPPAARIDPAHATEMPQPSVIHTAPPPPTRHVVSEQSFPTMMQPRPPAPQGVTPIGTDQSLVGSNVAGVASSAFDRLNQAVQESVPPPAAPNPGPPVMADGKTIEDMVKEILRPMLKDWLDRNLPPMVERIVEREIVRLTRR